MSRAAVTPKGRVLRHPGDLQWLERRRLQAADLFAQGKTKAEVAGELGVSAQTGSRWYARWLRNATRIYKYPCPPFGLNATISPWSQKCQNWLWVAGVHGGGEASGGDVVHVAGDAHLG